MKFLIILLCAGFSYSWTREKFSFSDAWFFQYRAWMKQKIAALVPALVGQELITQLIILLLPALLLAMVLAWLEGVFFGLFTLLIHATVLLYGFGRINFGNLLEAYHER